MKTKPLMKMFLVVTVLFSTFETGNDEAFEIPSQVHISQLLLPFILHTINVKTSDSSYG